MSDKSDLAQAAADAARYARESRDATPPAPRLWPRRLAMIVIVLAVAAVAAWLYLSAASPEQKVRQQFGRLAELVGKNTGETNTLMAAKNIGLDNVFADTIVVQTAWHGLGGEFELSELTSSIFRYRNMFDSLSVSFAELEVTVTAATEAEATFVLHVRGSRQGQESVNERRPGLARLRLVEKRWRFYHFQELQILEK